MSKQISCKKAIGLGIAGAAACSVVTGLAVAYALGGSSAEAGELSDVYRSLQEVQQLVNDRFVGEYDMQDVENYVLTGYISGLKDRWSYYLTPDAYQEYLTDHEDTRVGIGVTVRAQTDDEGDAAELIVIKVTPGSPAEKAGFAPYDAITEVDGTSVKQLGYEEAVDTVRGEAGTDVVLTVVDNDTGETEERTVTRAEFEQIYVTSRMLEGNVGYVKIDQFMAETDEQFIAAVDELREQGAERLIFDLRDNPGGALTSLVNSLDYLLPEGTIITLNDKSGQEETYTSDADEVDLPMAVLVNTESYSAAEFFAEALREYDKADIVGERTSGKGYSQVVYPLNNGGAVGLSSSCYYTPDGSSLIDKGVQPDVECSLTEEQKERQYALSDEEDGQLQAALDAVNKR